ncbi:hypothetical protein ACVWWO_003669 [Bradyrhizobium sp. F1.13.1]
MTLAVLSPEQRIDVLKRLQTNIAMHLERQRPRPDQVGMIAFACSNPQPNRSIGRERFLTLIQRLNGRRGTGYQVL